MNRPPTSAPILDGIHDFTEKEEIDKRPDELYAIVSQLWPELLHKVKPRAA